jgi:para-aminobenzoate synthetase component I
MYEQTFKCCPHTFYQQLLQWVAFHWPELDPLTLLTSCRRLDKYGRYYWLAAWGSNSNSSIDQAFLLTESTDGSNSNSSIDQAFLLTESTDGSKPNAVIDANENQWLFGRINYGNLFLQKPSNELAESSNKPPIPYPIIKDSSYTLDGTSTELTTLSYDRPNINLGFNQRPSFFYSPVYVLYALRNTSRVVIRGPQPEKLFKAIQRLTIKTAAFSESTSKTVSPPKPLWDSATYIERYHTVRQHLLAGNIYELNLTQPFIAEVDPTQFQPVATFNKLMTLNPVPMAALHRAGLDCALSFSPERFLGLTGHRLVSQPIKGTIERSVSPIADQWRRAQLGSEKYRAENVMIVDLVRNDFNRCCETHSVQVPGLFEVHTYKRLHHLVSSIIGKPKSDVSIYQLLESIFPAGSMTGAPKISAMQIIEEVEDYPRGLYAGSIGYIDPHGNFDFNVVIRTMLVNLQTGVIQYPAGGAITVDSKVEKEYQEMILKVNQVFNLI